MKAKAYRMLPGIIQIMDGAWHFFYSLQIFMIE